MTRAEQIDRIIYLMRELWLIYPEQTLSELLCDDPKLDPEYNGDHTILKNLEAYDEHYKNEKQTGHRCEGCHGIGVTWFDRGLFLCGHCLVED